MTVADKVREAKSVFLIDEIGRVKKLGITEVNETHVYAGLYQIPLNQFGKHLFLRDPQVTE